MAAVVRVDEGHTRCKRRQQCLDCLDGVLPFSMVSLYRGGFAVTLHRDNGLTAFGSLVAGVLVLLGLALVGCGKAEHATAPHPAELGSPELATELSRVKTARDEAVEALKGARWEAYWLSIALVQEKIADREFALGRLRSSSRRRDPCHSRA